MSHVRTPGMARILPLITGLALGALALGPGLRRGCFGSGRRTPKSGAKRRRGSDARTGAAVGHRGKARALVDIHARLLGCRRDAARPSAASAARRRGVLLVEPIRGGALDPWPVGASARLRRAA